MNQPILSLQSVSKNFGSVQALTDVSFNIYKGTFHAIMGENGAGKSTIAKCIMGYYQADKGEIVSDGKKMHVSNPKHAHQQGIGMVYQHFMLVDNMSVSENFLIARDKVPAIVNWKNENRQLQSFMEKMPFKLDLKKKVKNLSAGEKQKLEILKMMYLDCRILILDEPTSVLTPAEADEVLSFLKNKVEHDGLTVIIITHKFREIFGYADEVSVLRKGRYVGGGKVDDFTKTSLAELMIGQKIVERSMTREQNTVGGVKLKIEDLLDKEESGVPILDNLRISVRAGEIYGIAGVSGNGQKRLVEILGGQKKQGSGKILVNGETYTPDRKQMKRNKFHCLPEEPLKNACIPDMSVADNMALRYFDNKPFQKNGIVIDSQIINSAKSLIAAFHVKTPSPQTSINSLSGGNVQRAVLARELTSQADVLVISNPCFGLDFNAISDIRSLIIKARNNGTTVLLLSEDLDEIIELSDRIGVIVNGSIIYETDAINLDIKILGEKMAGH